MSKKIKTGYEEIVWQPLALIATIYGFCFTSQPRYQNIIEIVAIVIPLIIMLMNTIIFFENIKDVIEKDHSYYFNAIFMIIIDLLVITLSFQLAKLNIYCTALNIVILYFLILLFPLVIFIDKKSQCKK